MLSTFENFQYQNNGNLKYGQFSAKVKKVVHVVLYGPVISTSDCRKAGPYQLPYKKGKFNVNIIRTFS